MKIQPYQKERQRGDEDSPAPTVSKRTPALGKSATTTQGTGKALHYGSTDKKVRWLLCGSVITTSSVVSAGKDLTAVAAAGRGSTAAGTSGGIHVMGQDLNDAEDLEPLASRYAGYKGKPLLPAKSTAGTGRKFVPRDAALRSSGEEGLKGVDEDLEGLPRGVQWLLSRGTINYSFWHFVAGMSTTNPLEE